MAGGQRASTVTLRQDLTDLVEEITFEDLNLNAERVAPSVSVDKDSGRYPVLPREAIMKVPDTRRQSDGAYARGQWEWEDDSYITYEYGFEEPIDNVDKLRDKDFIDHEEQSAKRAYEGLHLGRESRVASALYNTTTWTGASNTTALTNEWDDNANATPWADIDAVCIILRGKCGFNKKTFSLILSDDLVDYFFRTNEVKAVLSLTPQGASYSSYTGMVTAPRATKLTWMAEYFGIKEVIEVTSIYDTTKLAQTATIGKFWSNEYAFLGKLCPPGSNVKTQGAIKQLVWSQYSSNYIMESYEEPKYNRNIVRCREYRGIKTNTDYGHLISNMKTTVSASTGI
jgi:hypothetical protein